MIKKYPWGSILAAVLLAGSVGCELAPVKITEDSRRLQQIDVFVEGLRSSFEGLNAAAFSALYPSDRPDELKTIRNWMELRTPPQVEFTVERLVLRESDVRVSVQWEIRWKTGDSGPGIQRGNALFILTGKSDLRLQSIEGDNPFIAPGLKKPSSS